ncbi:MAG: 4-hydroxy-tetrahydrodipicolinate reductase [Pseudomonadota bacterium]
MEIGVVGCGGAMGLIVARLAAEGDETALAGGVERPGAAVVGRDLGMLTGQGESGITVGDDPVALFARAQAVIDFTAPAASAAYAELAAQNQVIHVIGTTGLGDEELAAIERAARHTAIVLAPNMSLGVTLLTGLVEQVARSLDEDYDIEVLEMHHRRKVDAPSGTALALGRAAAAGRRVALEEAAQKVRDGHTGARKRGDIGFATLRGGDVVGDHTVIFAAEGERLELTHKASSREVFARGALKAALWARDKAPGLYGMGDVLGLS